MRRATVAAAGQAVRLQRAARLLLAQPLLVAGIADDEDFRIVRAHSPELREWFDREAGWRLVADAQVVRLFKVPATLADATYPARDPRSATPFGRHRYVLVCLALAALDRTDGQVTLGRLAQDLLLACTDPALVAAGVSFTLDSRDQRADLVAVVRLLLGWGVVRRVHGDEESYLSQTGDVLYDVDRRVISGLLAGVRGASMVQPGTVDEQLHELAAEVVPDTDESRNRVLRHQVTRRLLEDPVVYFDELTPDELNYLTWQRSAIVGRISEMTGLVAEVRAEGIAMVDPEDELTDVRMPAQGMQSHLTLLLAEHIACHPDGVWVSELHHVTRQLATEHKTHWRKNATDAGAEVDLVTAALDALLALKLVSTAVFDSGTVVLPRPAIARYALATPTIESRRGTTAS
jgi:uncharacterized protein (TIGR02678 family)